MISLEDLCISKLQESPISLLNEQSLKSSWKSICLRIVDLSSFLNRTKMFSYVNKSQKLFNKVMFTITLKIRFQI